MRMKPLHILVSGPYGGLNYGDDAIALEIYSQLRKREVDVTLAVNNIEGAKSIYKNIPIVEQFNLRRGHFSSIHAIRKCDGVVIGGGEQFSEPRIVNPIWGHLATNVQLCFLARIFRKKFAVIGVGVDENLSLLGRFLMRQAFRTVKFIGVRDVDSQKRLLNILKVNSTVFIGADPAFLMEPFSKEETRRLFIERYEIPLSAKIVLIIPSIDKINKLDYLDEINETVKELIANNIWVFYAITDVQNTYDMKLFTKNMLYTSSRAIWLAPNENGLTEIRKAISTADCVISSRMHPIIFSIVQRTPFICLARSAKMFALMSMLKCQDYLELNKFSNGDLFASVQRRLSNGPMKFFSPMEEELATIKNRALSQFDKMITELRSEHLS